MSSTLDGSISMRSTLYHARQEPSVCARLIRDKAFSGSPARAQWTLAYQTRKKATRRLLMPCVGYLPGCYGFVWVAASPRRDRLVPSQSYAERPKPPMEDHM